MVNEMKYDNLIIEKKEYVFLKRLLNLSGYYSDSTLRASLKKLQEELSRARILDEAAMPADVVRLNSRVEVSSGNGWERKFQLVSPANSDIKSDKISILTPMGAAVMGYARGDSFSWVFPGGLQTVEIGAVEQVRKPIDLSVDL